MAASRRAAVAPFFAMEILKAATARAAEGARVFHMETGEPGSGAPKPVLAAAQVVLAAEKIGYTEAHGVLPLRERIAVYYEERYGFAPPVERIVVTTGASAGLMLAFLAAFSESAVVINGFSKYLAQLAKRRHGLAIAALRHALGDGWSPSSMRWNHLR